MKVFLSGGAVVAKSETLNDVKLLLSLSEKQGAKIKEKESTWKGKHRVDCAMCGKKFKNIKLHNRIKHGLPAPLQSNLPTA